MLAQLPAVAVEDVAGQAVAGFAAVEQVADGAAVLGVAAVLQYNTCSVLMIRPSSARARARLEGFGPRCRVRRIAEVVTVPACSVSGQALATAMNALEQCTGRLGDQDFTIIVGVEQGHR